MVVLVRSVLGLMIFSVYRYTFAKKYPERVNQVDWNGYIIQMLTLITVIAVIVATLIWRDADTIHDSSGIDFRGFPGLAGTVQSICQQHPESLADTGFAGFSCRYLSGYYHPLGYSPSTGLVENWRAGIYPFD